jgi:D-alanyl-D-alanine carboxypeptidase
MAEWEWRVREEGGTWEVPRPEDQRLAIANYMTTQKREQNVPHHSKVGRFNVNFGNITTSYTKDNRKVVEVMFGPKDTFAASNRVMDVMFKSTKRKNTKRKSTKRKSTKRKSTKRKSTKRKTYI